MQTLVIQITSGADKVRARIMGEQDAQAGHAPDRRRYENDILQRAYLTGYASAIMPARSLLDILAAI